MHTQIASRPGGPLNLLSAVLSASAVIVLLAPLALAGSLDFPNLQAFALQLLSTFALLGGGFFASVAAANGLNEKTPETSGMLESQPACGSAGTAPARRPAACAANPIMTTPAHATLA